MLLLLTLHLIVSCRSRWLVHAVDVLRLLLLTDLMTDYLLVDLHLLLLLLLGTSLANLILNSRRLRLRVSIWLLMLHLHLGLLLLWLLEAELLYLLLG